ncbi:hypothetical protein THPR109532_19315 [Thalassospira profundimaris]
MKWSWGYRWEQERSPDWQVSGAITLTSGFHKGRDSPFDRWVQGERSLPRVMERRNVLMALDGFNAQEEPRPEGCNGSAQRAPLPRLRCSTPHILRVGLIDIIGKTGDFSVVVIEGKILTRFCGPLLRERSREVGTSRLSDIPQ